MLDVIVIAGSGNDTFSVSSSLRLQVDGKSAVIQNVCNYLENQGKIVAPVIGEKENNWHCAPKLNGIALLNYLQKHGCNVTLIDSYYNERDRFIGLLKNNPRFVIISTTFIFNKHSLYELVRDIRSIASDIYIIAGGPFVYSSYLLLQRLGDEGYDVNTPSEDYLFLTSNNRPDIDLFIIDIKGESVLLRALQLLKNGQSISDLPSIAQWDGHRYVYSARSASDEKSNGIAIDWRSLPDYIFDSHTMNVQASNGCLYKCEFCNFVKEDRNTYVKPLDILINELAQISQLGIKYVRFVDDNFRLGSDDLNEVCQELINHSVDIKWMSFIRASTLKNADVELLKRAGCIEVQIGVESADRNILANMRKRANPDMYYHVIRKLLDVGIDCSCCFLVGFPGETLKSFQKTLDFIESIPDKSQTGLFTWSIYPFNLVPLSPIYEPVKRAKYGLSGYMNKWNHFSMDSKAAHNCIVKAFLDIENSSPIYSGDNIKMVSALTPEKRRKFNHVRHNLAKRFLEAPYDSSLIITSFSEIFSSDTIPYE